VPVPQPFWLDGDGSSLGMPGYVMARTTGTAPSPAAFVRGPLADASDADRDDMIGQVVKTLVSIHSTDLTARGLSDFVMNAPGSTPMERCINWYWQTWEWVELFMLYSKMRCSLIWYKLWKALRLWFMEDLLQTSHTAVTLW
jgi:aminoglycoside phosphotransferase (APT) family kinase protein